MRNAIRPYWHVDAKWISAIGLAFALACTLPIAALFRATDKAPAQAVVTRIMANMMSPHGVDSTAGVDEMRKRIAKKGSETISLGGIPITITAVDVQRLSPQELRLKVAGVWAERFYELGIRGMAAGQKLNPAAIKKAEDEAALLAPFTRTGHERLGMTMLKAAFVDLALFGLVGLFSRRFGRLVSPGVVMIVVGLPGPLFWTISTQRPELTTAAARGDDTNPFGMIAALATPVAPIIMKQFATVYVAVLLAGAVLLVAALLGRTGLFIRTALAAKHAVPPPVPTYPSDPTHPSDPTYPPSMTEAVEERGQPAEARDETQRAGTP